MFPVCGVTHVPVRFVTYVPGLYRRFFLTSFCRDDRRAMPIEDRFASCRKSSYSQTRFRARETLNRISGF